MALEEISAQIVNMLQDISRKLNGVLRDDELDYIIFQIERIETIISLCMQTMEVNLAVSSKISEAKYLLLSWRTDRVEEQGENGFQTPKTFSGDRGRPQYNISKEQLEYFIEFGFKASQIATILGVSEATIRRKYRVFEISSRSYTDISDDELDNKIKSIKGDFHQSGYRMVTGILRANGIFVQNRRVLESMRRVDLEGVIMRSLHLQTIHRRKYKVNGPSALWHIDTNHKLIRLEWQNKKYCYFFVAES